MSTSTTTPEQSPKPNRARAVHQPFSWIDDAARDYPMADFLALTLDVCNGIQTCLEIIESSDLECTYHSDLAPDNAELPVVSAYHAGILRRLSIASAKLLRKHADQEINWLNEHGPGHLLAMKARAK